MVLKDYMDENYSPIEESEIIPDGYTALTKKKSNTLAGIYKIKIEKHGKEEIIREIPLCHTYLRITTKRINTDNGKVYYDIDVDGNTVTLSGEEVATRKGITKLSLYGAILNEHNASDLIHYFREYIHLNEIPEKYIFDKFGWKKEGFFWGSALFTPKGRKEASMLKPTKQTEAIHSEGSLSGWVVAVDKMLKHDPQRFKMYAAVVPLILKPLNKNSFSLLDFGETSIGKTVTSQVAMSVYGNPKNLTFSGRTTPVGIERTAYTFCDLPINIDDVQTIKQETIKTMVYMLGNGMGKIRGAKDGGLQENLSWRTVVLMTSENPILSDEGHTGEEVRLIEYSKGLGDTDIEAVSHFEKHVINNYGVFAPVLIEYILNNLEEIRQMHNESTQTIHEIKDKYRHVSKQILGKIERVSETYATILTAGKIFEKLYSQAGGSQRSPGDIVISFFENATNSSGDADLTYADKGLVFVNGWIAANWDYFLIDNMRNYDESGKRRYGQIYGNIKENYIDIIPHILKDALEKQGFYTHRLVKDWTENGVLETDKNKRQKTVKIEQKPVKVYRFYRSELENHGGGFIQ